MKNLYIVRHGKSTWDIEQISDIDRPLKERGIRDGYMMANRLIEKGHVPELIVSSPAARAIHSATIFARTFKLPHHRIILNEGIYHAGTSNMLKIIQQTQDDLSSLMVFGHNPTFTDLANFFINKEIDNIPTTGIVGLKFEIKSWKELNKQKSVDWFFDFPKNID